jgi:photosystem II stability/assembly factor-like uncharacterized protein
MAHDVFISHSAKDKVTGDAVCAMLESNGVRCWIAPRDVVPGMEWSECIIDAIEQSRIMILVFSANANTSPQIRREVERAVNHGVAILPVRIEDILPGKALEYFIGNVHWLDALTPPLEAHLKSLAGTIKMLLARMEPRGEAPAPSPHPAEAALQETEVSGPVIAPAATPIKLAENPLAEPVAAAPVSAPAPVDIYEPEPTPAAETGPPSSVTQKALLEDHTEVFAAESRKPRVPRAWKLAILGGAAMVIMLVWLSVFLKSWRVRNSGTTSHLYSIFGTSDGRRAWAVGEKGTITESDDGGTSWRAGNSGTTESLNTIFGTTDGKRLWALTPSSIVASEDGGASWTERYGGRYKLVDIRGTGVGGEVWAIAIGGAIIESEDGGASWTARYHDTKGNISSIFVTSDGQRLWAVGECCTILGSDDGGASWKARYGLTDNNLRSIFGTSDGMQLWAVGPNGNLLVSGDGGATWTRRKSGTKEDLSSIFGTSDGKSLWVAGSNGVILTSGR